MKKMMLALAAFLLQACVSVLPDAPPPSARYQVADILPGGVDRAPAAWTLSVEEPEATLAFNTANIATSREPTRVEYYAGGQWVDRAPRLIGAALVRSFENTGAVKGVGSRITLPVSTYVLQTDLRRLAVTRASGALVGEVAIFARLTNGRGVIYASKLFSASAPVSDDSAAAAAVALNSALGDVQRALVDWTFDEADRAQKG